MFFLFNFYRDQIKNVNAALKMEHLLFPKYYVTVSEPAFLTDVDFGRAHKQMLFTVARLYNLFFSIYDLTFPFGYLFQTSVWINLYWHCTAFTLEMETTQLCLSDPQQRGKSWTFHFSTQKPARLIHLRSGNAYCVHILALYSWPLFVHKSPIFWP